MGTRIRKVMGYGFDDLEGNSSDHITDARYLRDEVWYQEELPDIMVHDFIDFAKNRTEEIKKEAATATDPEIQDRLEEKSWELTAEVATAQGVSKRSSLEEWLTFDPDGDTNIFLFTPPGLERWQRYGDPMDYHENYDSDNPVAESIHKVYPRGFHPFEDFFIDRRDGRRIPVAEAQRFHTFKDMYSGGEGSKRIAYLDRLADGCGFKNYPELEANMTPGAPEIIYAINDFLGIFNPEAMLDLKPMIYTYWS